MSARNSPVNPALIEAWVTGWALARNLASPVACPGGLRVDVETRQERVRYVLFGPDAKIISELTKADALPGTFVKVCASEQEVAPLLPPAWRLHGPQHVMTAAIEVSASAPCPLPPGCLMQERIAGPLFQSLIQDRAGRIVASGRLVLIGTYAIVDDVSTEPDQRRRGLGASIMADLMRIARKADATTGLLVATSDGYELYSKLGWEVHTPYTSAYNV